MATKTAQALYDKLMDQSPESNESFVELFAWLIELTNAARAAGVITGNLTQQDRSDFFQLLADNTEEDGLFKPRGWD